MDLVRIATHEIADILSRLLPSMSETWWTDLVWFYLSERQRETLAPNPAPTLEDLDLASLLCVVERNWSRFGDSATKSSEAKNYLWELRSIRNQRCHCTSRPTSAEIE